MFRRSVAFLNDSNLKLQHPSASMTCLSDRGSDGKGDGGDDGGGGGVGAPA